VIPFAVRDALEALAAARERLRELTMRGAARVSDQAASVATEEGLTPQGRADRAARAQQAERERVNAEVTAARAAAEESRRTVTEYLASAQQTSAAPDQALVTEMRLQRGWDTARQLLDAGRSIQEVITFATQQRDADLLEALRGRIPAYVAAAVASNNTATLGSETDFGPDASRRLVRRVDEAFVAIASGPVAEARTVAMQFEDVWPAVEFYADGAGQVLAGASPLSLAVGARVGGFDTAPSA
jgi:hypothetical protein